MSPVSAGNDREASWVIALGLFVAVAATALSLIGMLGRLTLVSAASCALLALGVCVLCGRALGSPAVPRLAWMALPWLTAPALAALMLPPHTWDEVAYGAALPRDYARAGRIFYNADYGAYSAFPANYEALVTASLLLTGDVWLTQLLNVVLALGMAVISVLLARMLGVSKRVSLVAGILVLCAPALIEVAPLTKNDVANAFFQSLAVLALVGARGDAPGRTRALLSGVFLGVSLGIKYSSLHFVLALAPFAGLSLARSSPSRSEALKRGALWAAGLVLVGSPWYQRNLALFSNPVFPFWNDLLGSRNAFTPEHSLLLHECFYGLADFSWKTGAVTTFATRVAAGFGLLPVILLGPGALLALRAVRRPAGAVLAGTAVAYLLLTLFAGFWEPRYFLSLLVLASSLAALALHDLGTAIERLRPMRPAAAWVAFVAAAAFAIWGGSPVWRDQLHKVRAVRQEGRTAFVANRLRYFEVAQWLNSNTSPDDRVAIGFNIQPFYYLDRSYYHIHPLTEGALVTAETPEQVESELRRAGATLLAFSGSDGTYFEDLAPRICAYRERLWQAQRRLRQAGKLRLVTTVAGVRILRLTEPQAASDAKAATPAGLAPRQ
jgi:hypothetical protein